MLGMPALACFVDCLKEGSGVESCDLWDQRDEVWRVNVRKLGRFGTPDSVLSCPANTEKVSRYK